MAIVIINQAHSLFPQQESLLVDQFGAFRRFDVASEGVDLDGLRAIAEELAVSQEEVIIASPIPALMKLLASEGKEFHVLHNDIREKKEFPNGKISMTVAKEGWVIV